MARRKTYRELARMDRADLRDLAYEQGWALEKLHAKTRAHRLAIRQMQRKLELQKAQLALRCVCDKETSCH